MSRTSTSSSSEREGESPQHGAEEEEEEGRGGEADDDDDDDVGDGESGGFPRVQGGTRVDPEEDKTRFLHLPSLEQAQEKKRELLWTPCFGAAGVAYAKGDRLHRLEKILNDTRQSASFWRVLAGRLPEKPSLLQLLLYTAVFCRKFTEQTSQQEKAKVRRREEVQRRASMQEDRRAGQEDGAKVACGACCRSERKNTGEEREEARASGLVGAGAREKRGVEKEVDRANEEVEMDDALKGEQKRKEDQVGTEGEEEKGSGKKRRVRRREDSKKAVELMRILTDFHRSLQWISRERAGNLPQLFESVVWCLMRNPFLFPYTVSPAIEEEEEEKKKEDVKQGQGGCSGERRTMRKGESNQREEPRDKQKEKRESFDDSTAAPATTPREWILSEDSAEGKETRRRHRDGERQQKNPGEEVLSSSPSRAQSRTFFPERTRPWRCVKKTGSGSSTHVSEKEVRVYVQQLWNRFESRLVIGLCSFLRFSLCLVSAIWSFDTGLLHELGKCRHPGRRQLEVLLKVLGLPLHFESQTCSLHDDEEDLGEQSSAHSREERRKDRGRSRRGDRARSSGSESPSRQERGRSSQGHGGKEEESSKRRRTRRHASVPGEGRTCSSVFSQGDSLGEGRGARGFCFASSASGRRRRRVPLLSAMCRVMLGSRAVVSGALESLRRRAEMDPPCTDELRPLELHLPRDYLDLLRQTLLRKCPQCGELPEHKAVCLLVS